MEASEAADERTGEPADEPADASSVERSGERSVEPAGSGPDGSSRPAPGFGGRLFRILAALRPEDLVLAAWVGLASPLFAAGQSGGSGPFDSGQPLQGALRLAGVAGALLCLATRAADRPAQPSILQSGIAGPVVGGLMLVGASGFGALGQDPAAGFAATLVAGVAVAVLGGFGLLPRLPVAARRALITPFVLAAGGIFWGVVRAVAGPAGSGGSGGLGLSPGQLIAILPAAAFPIAIVTAGAAVYYAMLIYAPRQIAEREGGAVVWLGRFALFLISVAFGVGWLSLLGG